MQVRNGLDLPPCVKAAAVAEKRSLGAIELRQRLRALAFLLIRASASQSDRNLIGDLMDELAVRVVKGAAGMDSHDQESHHFAVFAQPNRHHARFFRRPTPTLHRDRRRTTREFGHRAYG